MILKKVADLIWGDWLVALIFFTGIYYTFILRLCHNKWLIFDEK